MDLSLILLFSILFTGTVNSLQFCENICGSTGPEIRFPFGLSASCSFPGFNLSCTNQDRTIITLPQAGNFTVEFIDYYSQTIYLQDPENCLPKRFFNHLSLSDSPFFSETVRSFTFLNCTSNSTDLFSGLQGLRKVDCLSDENYAVIAMPHSTYAQINHVPETCDVISSSLPVTVPWPRWSNVHTRLIWSEPDCRSCEQSGGTCGFDGEGTLSIVCSNPSGKGLPRSAKYGIIIGVGIPGLLCLIGVACYVFGRLRDYRRRHNLTTTSFSASIPLQRACVTMNGLDGPTINSYPTTQLGESKRLPNPTDNTCPICLSEYEAKETIRTIPECNHYFHADCIDEWLKMNATCPLCRNSPDSSSVVTPSMSTLSSSSSVSSPRATGSAIVNIR